MKGLSVFSIRDIARAYGARPKGLSRRAPRRPVARWREAEKYFQRERDRKIPVSLPRVSFLEGPDDE